MSSSESMARGDPMLAYAKQYDALKAELQTLGFLCQGSLQTRLLPQSAPDVAGTVGDAGCHSGRGVR